MNNPGPDDANIGNPAGPERVFDIQQLVDHATGGMPDIPMVYLFGGRRVFVEHVPPYDPDLIP